MNVSDSRAGQIGPQEGPTNIQPQRTVSPAIRKLADGIETAGQTSRKPPQNAIEAKTGAVQQKVAAINAGKIATVAVSARQTQVLPRQKAQPVTGFTAPPPSPEMKRANPQLLAKTPTPKPPQSAVDRIQSAAAGISKEAMRAKVKAAGDAPQPSSSSLEKIRDAAAGMSREALMENLKKLSSPEIPPQAASPQTKEPAEPKGKEEAVDEQTAIDEVEDYILPFEEEMQSQNKVALPKQAMMEEVAIQSPNEKPQPEKNQIKAALDKQLLSIVDKKTGERGDVRPESERKELAASLALGYKITGLTTKQFMAQLKEILTDPNASAHHKEFAKDALKAWINQGTHKGDLNNKDTSTAFKELVDAIPSDQRKSVLSNESAPQATSRARKARSLNDIHVANNPDALMQRVKEGKASKKDILAAATAIRDGTLHRLARIDSANVVTGNVIVKPKNWDNVDSAVKEANKVMDAFTMQFKAIISNSNTAKEAESQLRFYQNVASTLIELGDLDGAFNMQNALQDFSIYETFKDKFTDYVTPGDGRWDRFKDKCLGEVKKGNPRERLEKLANPSKNFDGVRELMTRLGQGNAIQPFALISKNIVPTLEDPKFTIDDGMPDIEQLQMAKKAVLDPLLELKAMGQSNRTEPHPLLDMLLPPEMLAQATKKPL